MTVAEDFADRLQPAFPGRVGGFHHESRRPHAEDHPVPAPVERCGGLLHDVVGGGGPGRQESRSHPRQQRVGADVVGGHHDHPPTPAGPDPVLGERGRLGSARARGVDLCIRPARADDLGELRVTHRQAPEDEAPVEYVRVGLEGVAQLVDAPVNLHRGRFVAAQPGAHCFQRQQLITVASVGVVALEVLSEVVVAGEGGGKDDAGVVTHRIRQPPTVGQLGAQCRGLVVHDQRDSRRRAGRRSRLRWQAGWSSPARHRGRRRPRTR